LGGHVLKILIEVLWALLLVGVPVALFTLAMVWWALRRGYFRESFDSKALGREMRAMTRNNKKNPEKDTAPKDLFQKKWAKFGGSFYGIVAFFTYIVIEVMEIANMIMGFGGFIDFLKQININLIVSIFVEAFINFISAMIWPLYWMQRIDTNLTWIWFVIAYAGYWSGLKAAQVLIQRRAGAGS
jgi:hypothetical protein